ncbi:MAG: DUF6125 family protein [Acidobacteriia bacterium]|nr:DUF6125 family protein [Terriglobia bacterium]
MVDVGRMSREDLVRLLDVFAKNWLAHDGSWFLAAEEKLGLDAAIDLDRESWRRFAVAEARRIMEAFAIPAGGGLQALEKALNYRLYAMINKQASTWTEDGVLEFRMVECRVQSTRRRKGLPDFPCKSVGIVEFTEFARAVDPRIQTECLACPPDPTGDTYCRWRFTLKE